MEQLLVSGGAVGLVCSAGWLMLRHIIMRADVQDARMSTLMENHLTHNTAALIEMRNALQELSQAIRERRV